MSDGPRSPSTRLRTATTLLLGLLLVCNPFLLNAAGVGTPAYEYGVQELTVEDGDRSDGNVVGNDLSRIDVAGEDDVGIRGIACDGRPPRDRSCPLEQSVLDRGNVTSDTGPSFVAADDEYVALDGELYRRTAVDGDDGGVYGLGQVETGTVVEDVARSPDEFPAPVGTAIDRLAEGDGSTATVAVRQDPPNPPERIAEPVPSAVQEGFVVRGEDGYYYVRIRSVDANGIQHDPDSPLRGTVSFVGVLAGLFVLKRWCGLERA